MLPSLQEYGPSRFPELSKVLQSYLQPAQPDPPQEDIEPPPPPPLNLPKLGGNGGGGLAVGGAGVPPLGLGVKKPVEAGGGSGEGKTGGGMGGGRMGANGAPKLGLNLAAVDMTQIAPSERELKAEKLAYFNTICSQAMREAFVAVPYSLRHDMIGLHLLPSIVTCLCFLGLLIHPLPIPFLYHPLPGVPKSTQTIACPSLPNLPPKPCRSAHLLPLPQITESIFLGSDTVARDLKMLQSHGITHVLNAAGTACGNYHEAPTASTDSYGPNPPPPYHPHPRPPIYAHTHTHSLPHAHYLHARTRTDPTQAEAFRDPALLIASHFNSTWACLIPGPALHICTISARPSLPLSRLPAHLRYPPIGLLFLIPSPLPSLSLTTCHPPRRVGHAGV